MIGDKIRASRKEKKMTLQMLADEAEVTASYISQLERNLVDPSLSTLRKISRALGASMASFLEDDEDDDMPVIIIRSGTGRKLVRGDTISYRYISPTPSENNNICIESVRFELKPGTWDNDVPFVHAAEELIYILEGELIFESGSESFCLTSGDSIYIRPNVPHRTFNKGDKTAVGISFVTPIV